MNDGYYRRGGTKGNIRPIEPSFPLWYFAANDIKSSNGSSYGALRGKLACGGDISFGEKWGIL
jgi:hypothetical protein